MAVLEVPIWNSKFKKSSTGVWHCTCIACFYLKTLAKNIWIKHQQHIKAFQRCGSFFFFFLAGACNQRMWRLLARVRMHDKVCTCLFPDRAGLYQPSPQEITGCLLWSPCWVFHYSYYLWRRAASDKYPSDTHTHMHARRHTCCCCSALTLWCSLLRALPPNAS